MDLPAALLSRFDLKFLLLDHVDHKNDILLSKHVLEVHRQGNKKSDKDPKKYADDQFDGKFIRAYVKEAKQYEPLIPNSLEQKIVLRYVEMRQKEREETT